jgi:sulfite dehydrogenase (cytochrome) subunit B
MRNMLIATAVLLCNAAAMSEPIKFQLPPESATLADAPHSDVAQAACSACHSVDYITTQPRGFKDPKGFWSAEVAKMQKVYGAVVDKDIEPQIVEYLSSAYK